MKMNKHYLHKVQVNKLKKARAMRDKATSFTPCLNCGELCKDTFCNNKCYMGNDTQLEARS